MNWRLGKAVRSVFLYSQWLSSIERISEPTRTTTSSRVISYTCAFARCGKKTSSVKSGKQHRAGEAALLWSGLSTWAAGAAAVSQLEACS